MRAHTTSREMAASVLAGVGYCLLGSAVAGLLSSSVFIVVVLLLG